MNVHAAASPTTPTPARAPVPIVGVWGQSRSGTTWLAAIVDTHPRVAYRYEPFTRLAAHVPAMKSLRDDFREGRCDDERMRSLYRILLPADPRVSRPPFFEKEAILHREFGRRRLWAAARLAPGLRAAYARRYRPREGTTIAFKEVNRERAMITLAAIGGVRSLYIIRHPCAVVSSQLKGTGEGMMARDRAQRLPGLLRSFAPEADREWGGRLDSISEAQRLALLWRVGAEVALEGVETARGALRPVYYERLCVEPLEQARLALEHLGLDFTPQSQAFLRDSTSGANPDPKRYGVSRASPYFSVFRDPAASMGKWVKTITPEDRRGIMEVVRDSPAFAAGRREGDWDRFE